MSANLNVHLIGRFYNEMWNQFDKGLFPELLAEDIRFRGSLGQSAVGYGEFGQYVDYIHNAFADHGEWNYTIRPQSVNAEVISS